ncbi:fructosamine kinase family protein [Saccharomonospora azurea]|uniref:Fructosamine-3-kinase n=1 Tax=Saccharomonospora azurea NA-128 TaxID=882081 RepID=H8G7N2_9PSEU|nr:fructosamine kinase family protein [Saccharomonospora azurea]EHK84486.1 fructosamine-3-kinase [Saccharomonospora azurea SZMC 14600]EHY90395.1 fructosamine-3-kinase [Saccharomonospora azurea NA-128]
MTDTAARTAAERHTGVRATGTRPLASEATVVDLEDGRAVVVKRGSGPGAASAEAAGLRWLGEPGDVPIPTVHGVDDDHLVLDHVPEGRPDRDAAEAFGRGLARLHLRGAPAFGSPPPGGPREAWIGLARMLNEPHDDWPSFYARCRVQPYVRQGVDQGLFSPGEAEVFDEVCARLPDLAGPPEPPARLHGDAWSGNVHWATDGRVWLLDPAAHGGHRETDLAMLRLFSAPLLDHVLGAYREAAHDLGRPLASGDERRVPLHQLFPLLVHTVLFGGGYARQALAAARAALRD